MVYSVYPAEAKTSLQYLVLRVDDIIIIECYENLLNSTKKMCVLHFEKNHFILYRIYIHYQFRRIAI